MAAAIKHRGPDGYGFYSSPHVGFAHVRLSTLDLTGGMQPLANEDGRVIVTYDGEIYNHRELRHQLEQRGHYFRSRCDTEILVHAYEEWGTEMLSRLNGDFAFAIHDRKRDVVVLACDRFGARPLFYAQQNGDLYFGSEVKAIFATREVDAAIDHRGIDEVLTFGAARSSRTPFSGVASLAPGTFGVWRDGALWLRHYYELDYPESPTEPADAIEQLDELMLRSVGLRARSDVSVGAQVSGGLNSSIVALLAQKASGESLRTMSVSIHDSFRGNGHGGPALGGQHVSAAIAADRVLEPLAQVVWHAETPLLTGAPILMYHLARLTREQAKVVLRGDGADELFLGSEVFRETSVRRFCMRRRDSALRQQLFCRVFPELASGASKNVFWPRPFLDAGDPGDPLFSHLPRFLSASAHTSYADDFSAQLRGIDVVSELRASLPTRFFAWAPLNQAAYLETTTRLTPYVLSTYADRMSMAHGIESRFPFLDHRLFEFAAALPTRSRLVGLFDKEILRRWAGRVMPQLRATERNSLSEPVSSIDLRSHAVRDLIETHLNGDAADSAGIFDRAKVREVARRPVHSIGLREADPLLAMLSTHLWHHRFVQNRVLIDPLPVEKASVVLRHEAPQPTQPFSWNGAENVS
jgi:asparagine synthase (glutamine-hydrolysing)